MNTQKLINKCLGKNKEYNDDVYMLYENAGKVHGFFNTQDEAHQYALKNKVYPINTKKIKKPSYL